ncbi:MAG: PAS domain S-box protein, partial [Planctomycetota bacterium]
MRALLLLESSSTQRMLEEYLESRGYVVTLASSVDEAKALACREEQALFLVDRVMVPEGLDSLCRDLRVTTVAVRTVILALTLSGDAEDLRRLIEAGVDDYVVLPMDHEQLCARLLLAERRSAQRNELRFANERAQDSEHDLKAIADASPVKLWVIGPDGHATFFNRRYLEYTGRTLAQECGMGWAECLHPEDYSRCLDAFVGALKRHEEFRLEYRLRRADGSYAWFLSNAVPRHTQFGEFLGYIGSCVDITEQKQSEGVLRSSEERLRLVVRNMPVMMVGFDERHRIIVWNRECERVTGYRAEEVILNPKIMNLIAPQHEEREALLERWSRPVTSYRDWEMSLFCRDGEVRTVAWSNISDELRVPGWATWAIGVDITDRRRAEDEHRRLQSQIQETQKYESLGVLAGGVAHDFNNILVGIMGKASLARRELEAAHPAAELIRQVEEASQIAAELTDQMLAYSGRGTFVVEPVDLSRLLSGMVHLFEVAVPQSTEMEFFFDDALHAIQGDATQMRQIAMNLVTNAGEAIGEQPGRIRVSTRELEIDQPYLDELPLAEGCEPGNYCVLEVTDNGCGMDPELGQKIFDPFFTTK